MQYQRIDASFFIELFEYTLPKVIVFEIVNYGYNICSVCKHYVLKEYKCNCGIIQCRYHSYINVIPNSKRHCYSTHHFSKQSNIIKCIIPQCIDQAWYGYKDSIHYCYEHSKNKYKVMYYGICYVFECYRKTNIINSDKHMICLYHIKPHKSYSYKYVKN